MRRHPGGRADVDRARSNNGSETPPPASPLRRAIWVVALCAWGFALLSMISFDAADWPSHVVAVHPEPPTNFGGRAGAMLAYRLLLVFGSGAWVLVVAGGAALVVSATGRAIGHPAVRAIGVLLATVSLGGLHAVLAPRLGALTGVEAGLLGIAAAAELGRRFGGVVVVAILGAGLVIGAVTAADRIVLALPRQLLAGIAWLWRSTIAGLDTLQSLNPLPLLRRVVARLTGSSAIPASVALGSSGTSQGAAGASRRADGPSEDSIDHSDHDPDDRPIVMGRPVAAIRNVPADLDSVEREVMDLDDESLDESPSHGLEDGLDDDRLDEHDAVAAAEASAVRGTTEDEDEDEDDGAVAPEVDAVDGEPAAPADSAPHRLSPEELRAKIARLPLRMTGRATVVAREEDIARTPVEPSSLEGYRFPTLELLEEPDSNYSEKMESFVRRQAQILEESLQTFSIDAEVVGIESGPVVTLFSVQLAPGTRVARLQTIASDIARSLQAQNIRILPNTAGKTTVGIEVPNIQKEKVRLKELMSGGHADGMALPMFLGKDASGEPLVADLTRMPHMLIAGTTGSGKSVCMNSIIMSWLYTKRPDELKLVLVDPKMVEMSQFGDIPHLMCPVVTEMGRAAAILEWAVTKMEERYELLKEAMVRDIGSYNALTEEELYERFDPSNDLERAKIPKKLPYMVFVIDELADLMMTNKEVEHFIVRIAQKARAVGIHLILATQRPQANVVTGLIKSNMPCRVSFKVASGMDSRIVLDSKGAELLLGQGDMLFLNPKTSEIRRSQGTLVTDGEIRKVTKFLREVAAPSFERSLMTLRAITAGESGAEGAVDNSERDPLFDQAVEIMIESGRGSVSLLQRRLAIGYSRASRLVDQMGLAGILGEHKGSVAREVIITLDDWKQMKAMEDQAEKEGTVFAETDGEHPAAM
ncbi:MAG: DNA translocase FtsK [Phycisphaerales bacterium]